MCHQGRDKNWIPVPLYGSLPPEEQEKIFSKAWVIACHESEVAESNDYRTFLHPAGKNLLVVRGEDGKIRTFYNVCPHRGNTIVHQPSGNARHLVCIFHAWAFNTKGDCIDITRDGKEIYVTSRWARKLTVIDVATRKVVRQVNVGKSPHGVWTLDHAPR